MPPFEPFQKSQKSLEAEPKKQVSLFVPLSEYRAIRDEAARRKMPMTELVRGWMRRDLDKLMKDKEDPA